MPNRQRPVRIIGDGLAWQGPCLLTGIIFVPDANDDYVDVYDGRDATTGEKVCRVKTATKTTLHLYFGSGIYFDGGIYLDGYDAAVETTVLFTPV